MGHNEISVFDFAARRSTHLVLDTLKSFANGRTSRVDSSAVRALLCASEDGDAIRMRATAAVCFFVAVLGMGVGSARATETPKGFVAKDAKVDGGVIHYTSNAATAGSGPAVILLHGFAETSRRWRR